jgi:threonine synthase
MASLSQSGAFGLTGQQQRKLKAEFHAASGSEAAIADAIRAVQAEAGYVLETHTACGVIAAVKLPKKKGLAKVILATAHPAKFPEAMVSITGQHPALPKRLSSLLTDKERITHLPNDLKAVETFVEQNARAIRAVAA